MRSNFRIPVTAAGVSMMIAFFPLQPAGAQGSKPEPIVAWSPQPSEPTPWVAPNKPHWKLSEILARHAGQRSWSEDIVSDRDFTARYIAMAPGEKTRTQFYADDRVVWIVQVGELKVTIEGQQPFVASKGFLVQVPYRTPYSMETVGSAPSLRFEVTAARATPLYPLTETPAALVGKKYVKVSFTGRGEYDAVNKPCLDFEKDIVTAGGRGGPFVKDDKTWVNVIRGPAQPVPPPTNLGHFHVDFSEFWFVLEGRIDYLIEGLPIFTAEQGDVVYAPQGRWHRASSGGAGMATRIAINPRPDGMHNYQPPH
jgi:mannose-6-phosphate isomerase-like protein (cupin superfamily)